MKGWRIKRDRHVIDRLRQFYKDIPAVYQAGVAVSIKTDLRPMASEPGSGFFNEIHAKGRFAKSAPDELPQGPVPLHPKG
jgi:hypothetical protein